MKFKIYKIVVFAAILSLFQTMITWAIEAPGAGGNNWHYNDKNYHWYYYNESRNLHTGWLFYEANWYWFDSQGEMESGGSVVIDGAQYYFFSNGQMAYNQYVGLKYYNQNGQYEEKHDIRVVGNDSPTPEDRDMITDGLYEIPRGWFAQFQQDGWQMMFYKQKSYFAAPDTDMGIYYVYHDVDTRYKKVKFTNTDALLQAFGEYIGYASGYFEDGNLQMQTLWAEQVSLNQILNIPDYYSGDVQFYFGKLVASYLKFEDRKAMEEIVPGVCSLLGDLLHSKDLYPEYYQKAKDRAAKARQTVEERQKALGGPGVKKEESREKS